MSEGQGPNWEERVPKELGAVVRRSQECREGFQHGAVLNVESKIQNIFKHADSQMKEPLCS